MKLIYTSLGKRYDPICKVASVIDDIEASPWEPKRFPVFDVMDDVKPDVVFLSLKDIDNTTIEAVKTYKDTKFVLFSQVVPPEIEDLISLLIAEPSTSDFLRKNIQHPDRPTLYLSDCADLVDIYGQESNPKWSCDIGYFLDHNDPETYTNQIPVFCEMAKLCRLKIVGPYRMGLPEYLGNISFKNLSQFYKSCNIVIDYDGHTLLNAASNGVFCLSALHNHLYPTLDFENLEEQLTSFLNNKPARNKITKKANKAILASDTSFHRMSTILKTIGYKKESRMIIDKLVGEVI